MEEVRQSSAWVARNSSHVTVDSSGIEKVVEKMKESIPKVEWDYEGIHYFDNGPLTVQYLFVLDALNFCFWPDKDLNYDHLAMGLKEALLNDNSAFDADRLQKYTGPQLRELLKWPRPLPLEEERVRLLHEVGFELKRSFEGKAAKLVESCEKSAVKLVALVTRHFPGFRDHSVYKGHQVFLYKRAQIFASDLWGAFKGQGYGEFNDISSITMFADYIVPAVLHQLGVLKYNSNLANAIEASSEIGAGTEEEVELRACSIYAVEKMRGGSHPRGYKEVKVVQKHEAWFVKVVCTLFVYSQPLNDGCLGYLSKNLTPFVEFQVVKWLNNPAFGLKFFEFSRLNLNITHSFWTYSLLLRSFCHMGLYDSAKLVFDYMTIDGHLPDSTLVGFMISAFGKAGKFGLAKKLLAEVQSDEVAISIFTLNNLLNMMVKQNKIEEAVSLYKENLGSNFSPDNWTFNILIRGLCRVGQVDQAFEFFNDMRSFGCFPDIVTYNTIINGLCRANELDRGHKLLIEIQSRDDCLPDVVTYTSVISGYCKLGKMEEACALFNEMISSGTVPSAVTFNVLIDGFGKVGDILSAKSMYEQMASFGCIADVVTFTSLIDGYCRIGDVNQSLQLWNAMKVRNISPNVYTFAITINALCKENRLQEAREFLRELKCTNFVPKPFIFNPVIDGFCKAGNLDEANLIVVEMEEKKCYPDKVTYTILIIGHCMKGRMLEAISLFNKMLSVGCTPDDVTVHSLVSCLLKAGMPNEASRITTITSQDMKLASSSSLDNNAPLRINRVVPVAA